MALKILNSKEKESIVKRLNEQFGINDIKGQIVMMGREKMFIFSGSFDENKINEMQKKIFIEMAGVYFAKVDERTKEIRLTIEGTQYLKSQIKKNIFEIDEKQAEDWMKGRELLIQTGKKGFIVLKHGNDFLGTGKASEQKIGNFIPKNRRLRERS